MSGVQAGLDAVVVEAVRDLLFEPEINCTDPEMVHAQNGLVMLTVLGGGRVFKRRAIKRAGTPRAEAVCWLVAELGGVRVYVNGDQLVISKQDLYP